MPATAPDRAPIDPGPRLNIERIAWPRPKAFASGFRRRRLADAAGDHHLRLRDRLLSFGPRSSFGFFMQPMSREFSWGRDVFGLALAVQNLLWGLGQPIAGAIADRFGALRVIVRRRAALCRRPDHDALCRDAAVARSRRRRSDRLRPVRLFVQSGAVGVQQAAAAGAARPRARRRHRGRIVRAIPVRAVRRRDDRQFRLADGADGVRRPDAADRAAVAGAGNAAGDIGQCAVADQQIVQDRRWRKRSAIAPMCCWCSASSPAAFSSPSSPCICRPIWSIAACRRRPAAG